MSSDSQLAARARSGDRHSFGLLFLRHHAGLVAFFERRLRNREAARDAAQESFLRAFAGLPSLRCDERVRFWLFGIARNVLKEAWRQRYPQPPEPAANPITPEALLVCGEQRRALEEALMRLPAERRAALFWRAYEDSDYGEIGERLGWRRSKVKNEIHRARAELRTAVSG